jgi:DNA-binding winged helix-turn-helix (wHTH) protein
VHLTPKAFDLLTVLVAEAPRIVPKSELHRRLWPDAFVADTTLVGVVKELRRALIDDDRDGVPFVRTAHRVGYGFGRSIDKLPTRADVKRVARWVIVASRKVELADG